MRVQLFIFLFTSSLKVEISAQLPPCKDSFPSSLLLNNSFEDYSGCNTMTTYEGGVIDGPAAYGGLNVPHWHSFALNTWNAFYFNYNCRSNKLGSVFDTTAFLTDQPCIYYFPRAPLPLPDSNGFIGVSENDHIQYSPENRIPKNYITYCISQPLYAGQAYTLSFYFGFGTTVSTQCPQGYPGRSQSPYEIAIFGRQDCPNYPLTGPSGTPELMGGCLSNSSGWVQLGKIILKGNNEWVTAAIEFTPQTNIACIGVGPDCTNHAYDYNFYGAVSMHYMDKFVLAPKADFSFRTITAISGDACKGQFVLKAPPYNNATYQWYKDGALIAGATSETYTVPEKREAAGNYVVNIGQPYNTCLNSLPFPVTFSELHDFNLGNDTLLCAPATITLNAGLQTAVNYLWQDGSTQPTLLVDKTGLYWVQVTDNLGCAKKDSVKVTIEGCDKCQFFIPSAFSPNDDGLNDILHVKPQCPNIELKKFVFRIYNRWGQVVFATNDMSKGWDGKYRNKKVDQGVYIYLVDYSFKGNKIFQQKGIVTVVR